MKKLMKKRTGFTLVELLIVIIIIGILAGAMLLVAGSGTDKAEATRIVSNMRSIKAAALMRWADDSNWGFVVSVDGAANMNVYLGKYMDRDMTKEKFDYALAIDETSPDVFSVKAVVPTADYRGVQDKLAAAAQQSGLCSTTACTTDYVAGKDDVFMRLK